MKLLTDQLENCTDFYRDCFRKCV